jgi:hypothetical protein
MQPKFLTKAERQALALQRRQEEAAELRAAQDEMRKLQAAQQQVRADCRLIQALYSCNSPRRWTGLGRQSLTYSCALLLMQDAGCLCCC